MRRCLVCKVSIEHRRRDAKYCENSNCRAKSPYRPRCLVYGCGVKQLSKGYCSKHYQAWKAHGDPLINNNVRRRRTHCKQGHEYTPENRTSGGGCRRCKSWQNTAAWRVMRWTEQEFFDRLAAQGNRCVICGNLFVLNDRARKRHKRMPCFDHCHISHAGRGIICLLCNIGLGSFADDPDRLEKAVAYLRAPLLEAGYEQRVGDRSV